MFQNRFVMENQALKHQSGWYKMKYRGHQIKGSVKGQTILEGLFFPINKIMFQKKTMFVRKFKCIFPIYLNICTSLYIIDIQKMGLTMKQSGLFLLWFMLIQQKIVIFKYKKIVVSGYRGPIFLRRFRLYVLSFMF